MSTDDKLKKLKKDSHTRITKAVKDIFDSKKIKQYPYYTEVKLDDGAVLKFIFETIDLPRFNSDKIVCYVSSPGFMHSIDLNKLQFIDIKKIISDHIIYNKARLKTEKKK